MGQLPLFECIGHCKDMQEDNRLWLPTSIDRNVHIQDPIIIFSYTLQNLHSFFFMSHIHPGGPGFARFLVAALSFSLPTDILMLMG